MPIQNDFVPIAIAGGANVEDQADYIIAPEVATGFATGESPTSILFNKMMRQASTIAAAVAMYLVNNTGQPVLDNGNPATIAALLQQAGRTKLLANQSFYVSTAGNDANDGLTLATPKRTAQAMVNALQAGYDLNGFVASILRVGGNYTDGTIVAGPLVGQKGRASLVFDIVSTAVSIASAASCYVATDGGCFTVQNQGIASSGGYGLIALCGSSISHQGNNFGVCAAAHTCGTDGGFVSAIGNYAVSGSASSSILASVNGSCGCSVQVTIIGNPNFAGGFAEASQNGTLNCAGFTFVGAGATGARAVASLNGVIDTNGVGAAAFPGNSSPAPTTGGQIN